MKYEPTYESVHKHQVPEWFHDAKFGIFIHWSLFSVPAFAGEQTKDITESFKDGMENIMLNYPYAEWYLNSMKIEDSETEKYHKKHYGDKTYESFQKDFEEQNKDFDVQDWVDLIKSAGAKYLVFVTKHHDGYLLWPAENKNPKKQDYHSNRDFVGELTVKARRAGLKMGLYYSGVYDWTFKDEYPIDSPKNFLLHMDMPQEYIDYSVSHFKELIDRYKPSVLWNDISFPYGYDLNELFAYYYNNVENGAIDDRWMQMQIPKTEESWKELEKARNDNKQPGFFPEVPQSKPHYDFITPEYREFDEVQKEKWECTRGIGRSFGFNRIESGKDYLTGKQIIDMLVRVVSRNGNLLLNIGPRADGTVPFEQVKSLLEIGEWLEINGEAIYGTRPNDVPECKDENSIPVVFTKKDDVIYAISLAVDLGKTLTLKNYKVKEGASVILLGTGKVLYFTSGNDTIINTPKMHKKESAYVFKIQ